MNSSTTMARKTQHRFHGDPARFQVMAEFISDRFGRTVKYIADVAGGRGMLTRILRKKFNYQAEVVDPRGWTLKGVPNQAVEVDAAMATYYDLLVGLHCDEAIRAVAACARVRPVVLVPCCNFWSEEKLSGPELIRAVETYYDEHDVPYERVTFPFKGPKNVGIVSTPPQN